VHRAACANGSPRAPHLGPLPRGDGAHLPEQGLPVELTRLPLIESGFELHARSHVGAAGIWQFMPRTGRLFMRVDTLVDERRDPIAATRGAARFLRRLHDRLGTWPLAITAYNHGPTGVARAVRGLGTRDIGTIVSRYDGPAFGRRAISTRSSSRWTSSATRPSAGALERDPPLRFHERRLTEPVHFRVAARRWAWITPSWSA
jgi:membrane-bound lytic murein transglycosylase D